MKARTSDFRFYLRTVPGIQTVRSLASTGAQNGPTSNTFSFLRKFSETFITHTGDFLLMTYH